MRKNHLPAAMEFAEARVALCQYVFEGLDLVSGWEWHARFPGQKQEIIQKHACGAKVMMRRKNIP